MKIADTAPLPCEDYWVMKDSWKMDWEKGVQVIIALVHEYTKILPGCAGGCFNFIMM